MKGEIIYLGFALIFMGILLVFLGATKEATREAAAGKTEVRGGGVIMIGPIPIVFGTDAETAKTLIILVIVLILVAALATRWMR